MSSWYVLMCGPEWNPHESSRPFQAETPLEAEDTARKIIAQRQKEVLEALPGAPYIVKGVLFRQALKLDGAELLKSVGEKSA